MAIVATPAPTEGVAPSAHGESNTVGEDGLVEKYSEPGELRLIPEYESSNATLMGFSDCRSQKEGLLDEQVSLLKALAARTKVVVLADAECVRYLASLRIRRLSVRLLEGATTRLKWIRDHSLVWRVHSGSMSVAELNHGRINNEGLKGLVSEAGIGFEDLRAGPNKIVGGNFQVGAADQCFAGYTVGYDLGFIHRIEPALSAAGCRIVTRIDLPENLMSPHLDMVFNQVDAQRVLLARYPRDAKRDLVMQTNQEKLEAMGYKVVTIPHSSIHRPYVNAMFLGESVFVPQYGHPLDEEALSILDDLGFDAVGLPMSEHADSGGAIHCLTRPFFSL